MNDFIKLTFASSKEAICIKKKEINFFEENYTNNGINSKPCTLIYLSSNEKYNWVKVTETVDEIMEMLEHE